MNYINNLGEFDSLADVWKEYPYGGKEGDYVVINGVNVAWNKYTTNWGEDTRMPDVNNEVNGDFLVKRDLRVGGEIINKDLKWIKEATVLNKGYFKTVDDLKRSYPAATAGAKAYVGSDYPYAIYLWDGKNAAWVDSGEYFDDSLRNKGYFATLDALREAYPIAPAGAKAYVGITYPFAIYLWDVATSAWMDSGETGGEEIVDLGDYYTKEEADEKVAELESETLKLSSNIKNGVTIPVETTGIDSIEGQLVWIKRYEGNKLLSPTRIDVVDNSGDSISINVRISKDGGVQYHQFETIPNSNIFSISLDAGVELYGIWGYVGQVSESGTYTISFFENDITTDIHENKNGLIDIKDEFVGLKKELFKDVQLIEVETESAKLLSGSPWNGLVVDGGGASSLLTKRIYVIPGAFYHIQTKGWYGNGIYAIYDSHDNCIMAEFDKIGGITGTSIDKIIQMPQDANYMRVAGVIDYACNIWLSKPKYVSSIESSNLITMAGEANQLLGRIDDAGNILPGSASYWVSEQKEILPHTQYHITARMHYSYGLYAFYDKDNNFITGEWANADSPITTISKKVLSPSNAKYLRIAYIVPVPSNILTEFVAQEKIIADSFQPFIGKKWAVMGDSLTEVNQRTSLHYHDYVAQVTGINVVNLGQSGTGYAKQNPFYNRIDTIPTDSDVVTIFGSFNDLSAGLPIGDITDNGTTTLCGCINKTLDDLFSAIPLVNLGIVTPTPWDSARPSDASAEQYVNAIVNICKYRSIPCLDLFHCSNLRPWDEKFRQLAYSHDDGNGVHPDETGHKLIAPRFEEFIKSLLLN